MYYLDLWKSAYHVNGQYFFIKKGTKRWSRGSLWLGDGRVGKERKDPYELEVRKFFSDPLVGVGNK